MSNTKSSAGDRALTGALRRFKRYDAYKDSGGPDQCCYRQRLHVPTLQIRVDGDSSANLLLSHMGREREIRDTRRDEGGGRIEKL
jgi:hypothetical protein